MYRTISLFRAGLLLIVKILSILSGSSWCGPRNEVMV
jgi:hypothetical protein